MSETTTMQEFNTNDSVDYTNLTEDILKELTKDYYSNIDTKILDEIEKQFFKPSSANPSDPNGIDSWSEYMVQNAKKGFYETIITFNSPISFNVKSPMDIANMIITWFKENKGFNNVKYHSSELDHIVNLIISWDVKDTENEDPTFFDELQYSIETYESTLKSLYYKQFLACFAGDYNTSENDPGWKNQLEKVAAQGKSQTTLAFDLKVKIDDGVNLGLDYTLDYTIPENIEKIKKMLMDWWNGYDSNFIINFNNNLDISAGLLTFNISWNK